MARDYEDIVPIEQMGDQELEDLIAQELREHPDLDADDIEIRVERGFLTLGGRVGTEQERQVATQVVTDVLGVERYSDEIVLDETRRGTRAEAADTAAAQEAMQAPEQTGPFTERSSDTAEHLLADLDAELYGSHDLQRALEQGTTYEAPDRPIQEGTRSEENH